MATARKILVFVPQWDPYPNFWPELTVWYSKQAKKYDLDLLAPSREPLHRAQGWAVKEARLRGCSHILFAEDDHWGFHDDALDLFLEADKPFIGCYSMQRRIPERSTLMRIRDTSPTQDLLHPDVSLKGMEYVPDEPLVKEVDLTGMGFTLAEVALFDCLANDPFAAFDRLPPDSHLCQYMADIGVKPCGHFGVRTNHGPITFQNRWFWIKLREIERKMDDGTTQRPSSDPAAEGWDLTDLRSRIERYSDLGRLSGDAGESDREKEARYAR